MSFELGEKVFAKVRKLPPWPGQIWEIKKNKYVIRFYPEGTKELVKEKHIYPFLKYFPSLAHAPNIKMFHIGVEQLLRDMTAPELIALKKCDEDDMFEKYYARLFIKSDNICMYNFQKSLRRLETFNFVLSSTLEEKKPSLIGMCVRALDDLKRMDITGDLLMTYPQIILTIMRLKNYKAVVDRSRSEEEIFKIKKCSEIVRRKAKYIFEYFEKVCPSWNEEEYN